MNQKHHAALRAIDIGILKQKHSIYTIFLKDREFDKQSDRTSQVFTDDQILLSPNLPSE